MNNDLIQRLKNAHPLQCGYLGGLLINHTENTNDPRLTDRFNRCHVCEQWSPCDVREAVNEIERLQALIAEWNEAKNGQHWVHADSDEWSTACDRLDAAEDSLKAEVGHG